MSKSERDFYKNRDNIANSGYDFWCKSCVNTSVNDKETMKEYCRQNNRVFSNELWEKQEQLATADVEQGKIGGLRSNTAKANYIMRRTISDYFKEMNAVRWYEYEETGDSDHSLFTASGADDVWYGDQSEAVYSEFWEGTYTRQELDILNNMLKEYEADFDIPDVHTRNMFKKVVKLSHMQDKATAKASEDPSKENLDNLEKLTKMMNTLSDSVKLNLAKRSSNDRGGFTDLGSLIARVESTGALMRKQEFPEDDVDITMREYISGVIDNLANEDMDLEIEDADFYEDGLNDGA